MPTLAALFRLSGVIALPGYFIADTPWAGTKTNTNWSTRTQSSACLGGGSLDNSAAQNDLFTEDHYFSTGTYKWALIHLTGSDVGIFSLTGINGTQTIDGYAATGAANVYAEVTGIAVTAGVKTTQVQSATKNASSTGFRGQAQSMAFVRTAA